MVEVEVDDEVELKLVELVLNDVDDIELEVELIELEVEL